MPRVAVILASRAAMMHAGCAPVQGTTREGAGSGRADLWRRVTLERYARTADGG